MFSFSNKNTQLKFESQNRTQTQTMCKLWKKITKPKWLWLLQIYKIKTSDYGSETAVRNFVGHSQSRCCAIGWVCRFPPCFSIKLLKETVAQQGDVRMLESNKLQHRTIEQWFILLHYIDLLMQCTSTSFQLFETG